MMNVENSFVPRREEFQVWVPMEEEEAEEESQEQHPLTALPGGATDIMLYLSTQDLKNCRLVSRQWNEISKKHLQEKVKVVLNSEKRVEQFLSEFKSNRNFFNAFQIGPFLSIKKLEEFFEIFGPSIKTLILNKTHSQAAELREILFRLAPSIKALSICGTVPKGSDFITNMQNYERRTCPDIETLELNIQMVEGVGVVQNFLGTLLSICPNLQRITIPQKANKEFSRVLLNVLLLSRNVVLNKLSCVDALLSVTNLQAQLLETKSYPLTHLNLQLLQNVTIESLLSLLSSLANTLTSLRLHFHLTQFKELPSTVALVKLKELTLEEYKGSLRFLVSCPAIKTLNLLMASFEELEDVFPTSDFWTSETMKTFRSVIQVPGNCSQRLIEKLTKTFPNLGSLSLQGLTDETLQLIFSSYPNLEELNATGTAISDAGITGISNLEKVTIGNLVHLYGGQSSRARLHPNISDLPKLRMFGLNSPRITDVSIYLGILMCKGIRILNLERLNITDSSIYAIMEQLDIHHFSITRCTRLSEPVLKFVQERMRGRQLQIVQNKRGFQL